MLSFLAGLFVGEEEYEAIRDNLDLERWFRLPKSHERRIHGHRHAGVRLVLDGPTLVPALDAHAAHPGPFTVDDLLPYRAAREPPCQTEARNRRTIMRKARSKKKRPLLPTVRSYSRVVLGIRARPFHTSQVVVPRVRGGVSAPRSTATTARASAR